ncbi:MAG: HrpE/YscL family type III secretion apparatus protein [Rhabdochlamydiaceae bacterium]|nr:HrpE/YscL family type III secretion apparatus protein [Rhabdochlamydiaceae bacterium]
MKKLFSYLFSGDLHLSSTEKIIPSKEFSQLLEAKEVLEKAVENSAEKHRLVEEECQRLREEAQKAGFQEGLVQFNAHFLALEEQARKIYRETQNSILKLALQAAKKIVHTEIQLHPETIVDIVLQALAPVKQSHRISIFVSKADKEILEENKSDLKEIFEQLQFLKIQERDDIQPGGCIIETENGIINASAENQWKALETAFQKYMK